jgi:hypothetical protein
MIAKMVTTAAMLFLAIYAFVGDALGAGHFFNPFGILFLALTALVWLGWGPVHDGFMSAKQESNLPIIRLSAKTVGGMIRLRHVSRRYRSPSPT